MSVKRFKFVSPGIFLNEVDNSRLPRPPSAVGPTIIGRLEKGPGLIPLTIQSMAQFVEVFGEPQPGGEGGDIWRDGNNTAPTYAAYAAQAYLQNSGPVNIVRLLGVEDSNASTAGVAGFKLGNTIGDNPATNSQAYGLYLFSGGGKDTRRAVKGKVDGISVLPDPGTPAALASGYTGSLAAVWYMEKGAIVLSGTINDTIGGSGNATYNGEGDRDARTAMSGTYALLKTVDKDKMEFAAYLFDGKAGVDPGASNGNELKGGERVLFNFDPDSDKYIRKVFNTNPTVTNTDVTQADGVKNYWLGETYDRFVKDIHGHDSEDKTHRGLLTADASLCAMIVPLSKQTNPMARSLGNKNSVTGWFISQDLVNGRAPGNFSPEAHTEKLFRFHGINDGGWNAANLKISIVDLKAGNQTNPYGTFTVLVRRVNDSDGRMIILERYTECSLDPSDPNYVGLKIGDQYREWDEADKRYRIYGDYRNQSSFVRIEVDPDVADGVTEPTLMPFGFYGPPRIKSGLLKYAANTDVNYARTSAARHDDSSDVMFNVKGDDTNAYLPVGVATDWGDGDQNKNIPFGAKSGTAFDIKLLYPTLPMRLTASEGGMSNPKKACFGVSTSRTPDNPRFEKSYVDVVRRLPTDIHPAAYDDVDGSNTPNIERSFVFTLDDLVAVHKTGSMAMAGEYTVGYPADFAPANIGDAVYVSGSRRVGLSYTARRNSWKDLIKTGFTGFTSPMWGGFDGLNIKEMEPFNNRAGGPLDGLTPTDSYAQASLKRAVDTVADPEVIEMNALSIPGVTDKNATDRVIQVCEDRADALAVVDVEKAGYIPTTEGTDDFKTRIQNSKVDTCVEALESRGINSSYACTFFPWVKILDQNKDRQIWVPPSVVALGTFAYTEANSELWFAPAGFTRGGLSDGAAGIPVLGVSQRLSTKERDTLYENSINPIAKFPAEGIVVFGQKTLQVTRSALDRINVRRLMIFVKKEVSRMAATLLFDNNVQATWDRFRGRVEPFLDSVKSRFGITEFKVILDESTTTPDLIDRNIMYAKIFLKPARAIEYIAIDFVITNSGASFED